MVEDLLNNSVLKISKNIHFISHTQSQDEFVHNAVSHMYFSKENWRIGGNILVIIYMGVSLFALT